jgi:hypothetical protein
MRPTLLSWTEFKALLVRKAGTAYEAVTTANAIEVSLYDGGRSWLCVLYTDDTDPGYDVGALNEWNASYVSRANRAQTQRTEDGRITVRDSTANRTTNFKLRAVSFYTADFVGGLHNVSPITWSDYGDVTVRLFKADDSEITVEVDEVLAVKTILDFEPPYNYEIIGGFLDIPSDLKDGTTDAWFISAVGVPDYPPEYFGQIDFISEVNIEAVTAARVTSDGRAISYLPYNHGGMPHTNLLRFVIRHPVGVKKRFQLYIEHFV